MTNDEKIVDQVTTIPEEQIEPELTLYEQYLLRRKKMSPSERKKMRTIIKLINGEINGTKAAQLLKITTRQVRNLKKQVLEEGVGGVVHKNKQYKIII